MTNAHRIEAQLFFVDPFAGCAVNLPFRLALLGKGLLLSFLCLRAMDYRTWAEITCGLARLIAVYINCFRRRTAAHGLVGRGMKVSMTILHRFSASTLFSCN